MQSFWDARLRHAEKCSWLLILTFPNGGSTALARTLLTGRRAVALTSNAEGQWLVPELSKSRVRWDPSHRVSPRMVRAVWLDALHRRGALNEACLVIEKSPPNMCRTELMLEVFAEMDSRTVVLTREPFAVCASWRSRYGAEELGREWGYPGPTDARGDLEFCEWLGRTWAARARLLCNALDGAALHLTYEDLTGSPDEVVRSLQRLHPLLEDVTVPDAVAVKDYPPQPLSNMNAKQRSLLSAEQLDAIERGLATDTASVERLGYDARWRAGG